MHTRRAETVVGKAFTPGAGALAACALAACILAACSTAGSVYVMGPERVSAVLRERGVDPDTVVYPHAVNDEMRAWVRRVTQGAHGDDALLDKLQANLLDRDKISVSYEWGYTGTAIDVFVNKKANCLAFTNLFVGLARELGIEVYYLGVNDVESYRKEGDLVVVSDHIAVGYGSLTDRRIFDFSETPPDNYRNFTRLSDLTAIAMFHSNRGAEALQVGHVEDSLEWLRTAVRVDPELANAWVNLGVALRRQGDHQGAEEAYRKALAIDPRTYSAYQNLSSLLRMESRLEEAQAFEEMLVSSPSRNPYTYVSLGDISLMGGRLAEAEKLYRRAIRLNAEDADAYAALGQLAVSGGDLRKARKMLRKAQKIENASEHPRVRQLERVLEKSGGRS